MGTSNAQWFTAGKYGTQVSILRLLCNYGHGGAIPGYTSSMRYFPDYGVAVVFQINTDVGISDDSTPIVNEMERRLTEIVTSTVRQ